MAFLAAGFSPPGTGRAGDTTGYEDPARAGPPQYDSAVVLSAPADSPVTAGRSPSAETRRSTSMERPASSTVAPGACVALSCSDARRAVSSTGSQCAGRG